MMARNQSIRSISLESKAFTILFPVYHTKVPKSFAVPVVTRYVADFMGFGHLIRSTKFSAVPYSENEIYQHITRGQIFLSYNADETKMLKRRVAFKNSMEFLCKLAERGNIKEASRWFPRIFGARGGNPMNKLGKKVAGRVLTLEKDAGKAAAILLLAALDSAYNSVLAVSP